MLVWNSSFSSRVFFPGKYYSLSGQLSTGLHKSFSVDTSDKTTSWITSAYLTVCWRKADGIIHPSSTTTSSESIATLWLVAKYVAWRVWLIFCDSDETSSLATALNYFHIMYLSISSVEHLFFFFYCKLRYISTQFLCLLTCLSFAQSWIFCYLLSCCFGVYIFVLFWMLWMLLNENKAKFLLQK